MDGVGTPIIGRPRPLPGHDTPNPAYHPHTLNYEEPVYQLQVPTSQKQSVISRLNDELGARTIIRQDDGVEVDVLAFGLSNSNLLDQMGLTYTRRDAQLADTFWLLGGAE